MKQSNIKSIFSAWLFLMIRLIIFSGLLNIQNLSFSDSVFSKIGLIFSVVGMESVDNPGEGMDLKEWHVTSARVSLARSKFHSLYKETRIEICYKAKDEWNNLDGPEWLPQNLTSIQRNHIAQPWTPLF